MLSKAGWTDAALVLLGAHGACASARSSPSPGATSICRRATRGPQRQGPQGAHRAPERRPRGGPEGAQEPPGSLARPRPRVRLPELHAGTSARQAPMQARPGAVPRAARSASLLRDRSVPHQRGPSRSQRSTWGTPTRSRPASTRRWTFAAWTRLWPNCDEKGAELWGAARRHGHTYTD